MIEYKYEKLVLITLTLGMVILSGCNWLGPKKEERELVLVNVLDKEYFDDCHIDIHHDAMSDSKTVESINVPFEQLENYAQEHWNKESTNIVIYCANYKCLASSEGARNLKKLGFAHVWAYEGGTAEWKHMGYPVKGACTKSYLTDFEKPAQEKTVEGVNVLSAEELKKMIEEYTATCC